MLLMSLLSGKENVTSAPATSVYPDELNRQCRRISQIFILIAFFIWLPYLRVDALLHPELPSLLYLRLGATATGLVCLLFYLAYRGRYKYLLIVTSINTYFVITTGILTALTGAHAPYMGGYCLVIMGTLLSPLPKQVHYGITSASIGLFFLICYLNHVNFDSETARYSLTDLLTAWLLSSLFIYFLDRIRYRSFMQGIQIRQQKEEIEKQHRSISIQNEKLVLQNETLNKLNRQEHSRLLAEQQQREAEQLRLHKQLEDEKKINQLQQEKLQAEIEYGKRVLAGKTMHIVTKNDLLAQLKEHIQAISKKADETHRRHLSPLIKIIDDNMQVDEDWEQFKLHFEAVNPGFFDKLEQIAAQQQAEEQHELTPKDLKMCAYLRMNMTNKEMASLMNLSVRSVEGIRYRLRKKLNVPAEADLVEFLRHF